MSFAHRTQRLLMRSWRNGDAEQFERHLNVPPVADMVGGVQSREELAAGIDRIAACEAENGFCFWALERLTDRAFLGFCGLKRLTADGAPDQIRQRPEIGWRLRADAWGQGYAREAAGAALDLAFGRFELDDVYAITLIHNARSWGLMRRLGMIARPELDFDMPIHGRHVTYRIGSDEWTE